MSVERLEQGEQVPGNGLPASPDSPSTAALSELRTLLFGPDQNEIRRIQQRLDDPKVHAADVSRILAEAFTLRPHPDNKLADALAPTLQEAFKVSVKKDPQTLVDAISPVMGPAIRKAISDALERMLQSLSQTLEYGFSPKGLRWRLEAFRTGKPFAELVLLHTLQFRVEQVFLIHRKTGLLLQHVAAEPGLTSDADMVSGMLTAIQDFVRDSFGGQEGQALDQARVGDLTIWIEQSPAIILAAVIRGSAPQSLRGTLQEAAETIQIELRGPIDQFQGDAGPFETSRPALEACLLQAGRDEEKPQRTPEAPGNKGRMLRSLGALLGILSGIWIIFSVRSNHRWTTYLQKLSSEPGIVITASGKKQGRWFIEGLRDPLSADPDQLARASEIDPQRINSHWEPYHSFAPAYVLPRARLALNPPTSVQLEVREGWLIAGGSATGAWINDARRMAPLIPGITGFQGDRLVQSDRPEEVLEAARAQLNPQPDVQLHFAGGVLTASGNASHEWVVAARARAMTLPGVTLYDDTRLIDVDRRYWNSNVNRIESLMIDFPVNGTHPRPGQDRILSEAADSVRKLVLLSAKNNVRFQLRITGHDTAIQSAPGIARQRAERVKQELIASGAPTELLLVDTQWDSQKYVAEEDVTLQVMELPAIREVTPQP